MRLLFFGDLASTGFGTVTMDLGRELLALGHDVRFVSQNELEDVLPEPFASRTWRVNDPSLFMPELVESVGGDQALGRTSLALASAGYQGFFNGTLWTDGWMPEQALILGDPGNIRLMVMRDEQTRAAFSMLPVWHYVPIEGVDLPPSYREMWSLIHPIAMTAFGATEIERIMGVRPPFVYHGVDSETFHPVSPERMLVVNGHKLRSKEACRRLVLPPDVSPEGRWVFRADRNVIRKRYPEFLRAMYPVLAERPDVRLLIHASRLDLGGDLNDWLCRYPASVRGQVVVTDRGGSVSRDLLVALYNASDLYVSNSAEGFGLTIAEALACGVPAVGIDYSAVTEVIGPGGVVTQPAGLVDNEYGYFWAAADEGAFAKAVGDLLDDEPRRKALGRAGVAHVRASFRWSEAARQFTDILSPVMEAVA